MTYVRAEVKAEIDKTPKSNKAPPGEGRKYSLLPYSKHQKDNWGNSKRILPYENESQLREFIHSARVDNAYSKTMYFGVIPNDLADNVLSKTGVDIHGYNLALRADEIRKIFKDHGTEKTEEPRGQQVITEDDIVSISEVIESPDDFELSNETIEGKPAIVFYKDIGGKITAVTYDSSKHKELRVHTMWKAKNKRSLSTSANASALALTPKTKSGTASVNSKPQNASDVNRKASTALDREYMEAINSGDMAKAQRMVDEQAKKAGYDTSKKLYHGTNAEFNVFKSGFGQYGDGVYSQKREEFATE